MLNVDLSYCIPYFGQNSPATMYHCLWDYLFSHLKHRAEPILQRIKEDRTRVVSPSFDNIKFDTFEIEEYPLSAQGFDWELWCRYLNPPKSWWTQRNHTAPIRHKRGDNGKDIPTRASKNSNTLCQNGLAIEHSH
ncbi:polypeptide N-acetylgalactosaminyltransferase 2-like [Notothenia coriiceps]|uniref:Polypeptide N-acetylgalactosaminyltransferase 2-like n=1 Tax=Notothenia coriiceps TaxID=8208 RepID=A0A6I9MF45_9TELE|nr:PREDICTED: polypeptide N-acetylgalactosaminyltransferase 2-like [Notothenia coriiceps]